MTRECRHLAEVSEELEKTKTELAETKRHQEKGLPDWLCENYQAVVALCRTGPTTWQLYADNKARRFYANNNCNNFQKFSLYFALLLYFTEKWISNQLKSTLKNPIKYNNFIQTHTQKTYLALSLSSKLRV